MVQERVDLMLLNYREYVARCEYLETDIKETERLILQMRDSLVEDMIVITFRMTGMPIPQGVSDPTGKVGDMVIAGYDTPFIREAEGAVNIMRRELAEKIPTVLFVNAWVRALDNKERFIIEQKTFGGLSWRQLIYAFRIQFGDAYTQQGLRRIKDSAMQKIYSVAK